MVEISRQGHSTHTIHRPMDTCQISSVAHNYQPTVHFTKQSVGWSGMKKNEKRNNVNTHAHFQKKKKKREDENWWIEERKKKLTLISMDRLDWEVRRLMLYYFWRDKYVSITLSERIIFLENKEIDKVFIQWKENEKIISIWYWI